MAPVNCEICNQKIESMDDLTVVDDYYSGIKYLHKGCHAAHSKELLAKKNQLLTNINKAADRYGAIADPIYGTEINPSFEKESTRMTSYAYRDYRKKIKNSVKLSVAFMASLPLSIAFFYASKYLPLISDYGSLPYLALVISAVLALVGAASAVDKLSRWMDVRRLDKALNERA